MMLKKHMNPKRLALLVVSIAIAALLWWGFTLLTISPIHKMARIHSPLLYYQGHVLIALAVMLACFHRWVAKKLLWIAQELHRVVSALLMVSVIGIDAMMHVFSIPHMEGWWLPLFGGSAVISSLGAWLHQWQKKPKDL